MSQAEEVKEFEAMWTKDVGSYVIRVPHGEDPVEEGTIECMEKGVCVGAMIIEDEEAMKQVIRNMLAAGVMVVRWSETLTPGGG